MKTSFLNELGITDQKIIDSIMAENGRDINNVRKELDAATAKVEGLESQLTERDTQLKELKKSVKDNETLTAKITELETANTNMKTEYEQKIESIKKDAELEGKLRDAKAKNLKAVRALIDMSGDIDKQIETLKAGEDTGFLFETQETKTSPTGTTPADGKKTETETTTQVTFADTIRNALKKG